MAQKTPRIAAIDAFRGFTVAGMIMVNNPGSWSYIYAPLKHASWHGCTPTDLVFPFFLLIVGMASYYSFKKFDFAFNAASFFKIFKRSVLIFAIGLGLAAFPFIPASWLPEGSAWGVDYSNLRIFGVLGRIALAYFTGVTLCLLFKKTKTLIAVGTFLMLTFWAILYVAYPSDPYDKCNNACRDVDVVIPGENHIYKGNWRGVELADLAITPTSESTILVTAVNDSALNVKYVRLNNTEDYKLVRNEQAKGLEYAVIPAKSTVAADSAAYKVLPQIKRAREIGLDPEGLLAVLSATATVIFGFLVGRLISKRSEKGKENVVLYLFLYGLPIIFLGMFWGQWFPINKALWTGPFVLYTGGLAMVLLAFFIWFMDVKEKPKYFQPFVAFGSNPLFLFVLSGLLAKTFARIKIDGLGLYGWLYKNVYACTFGDYLGSFLQAVTFIILLWAIAHVLHKNKIYIKV